MTTLTLPNFQNAQVLVFGDVMLDRYWHGDAFRISPEAPVPVVNVTEAEVRAGGAANVAQNIASLGARVALFGWVGDDPEAAMLTQCLDHSHIQQHFFTANNFQTITKLRVMGRQQQLIRMDFEKLTENKFDDETLFSGYCAALEKTDVVVLSDYSKGALCHVERYINVACEKNIPVLIDPKHKNYERYAGATMLTPNLKEFESIAGKCENVNEVIQKSRDLLTKINIASLLITLGKDGMVLVTRETARHFPTKARDVFDVTGAGDTVIGVLAAGMAARMDTVDAVEMANLAAGIVVGRLGAASVTVSDLQYALSPSVFHGDVLHESALLTQVKAARARGEKIVMTNGCFDVLHVGHADYLAKARALGDRLIVAVNDDASVRDLKGEDRPLNPLFARMQLLSALRSVDWVVSFSESTPARLIGEILPDILVKGGDYQVRDIAGSDVVLKNGGEVLTIPLTAGFSTTALIENAKQCMSEKV